MSENNTPEGRRCSCGKGVYIPYETKTETTYDGKKTVNITYKCSGCGHLLDFIVHKDL